MVSVDDGAFCSCPDFEKRQEPCKHVYAVEFTVQRESDTTGGRIFFAENTSIVIEGHKRGLGYPAQMFLNARSGPSATSAGAGLESWCPQPGGP